MKRFWDKVEIGEPSDCWPWIGGVTNGYGAIKLNGQLTGAHRVAFILAYGQDALPATLDVRHKCDNKRCVNPSHLEVGCHQENMADYYLRQKNDPKLAQHYYEVGAQKRQRLIQLERDLSA